MTSMIRKLLSAKEVPVSVMSTMASTSSGTFTSVEPQLNSTLGLNPSRLQKTGRQADRLGGNSLSLHVVHRLDRRILRYDQHPPRGAGGGFAILEFDDQFDIGVVLFDPIFAGNPAVQIAMLHVPAYFLSTQ